MHRHWPCSWAMWLCPPPVAQGVHSALTWWLLLDRSLELSEHPDEEQAQDPPSPLASRGCKAQDRERRSTTALWASLLLEVRSWPGQGRLPDPAPRAQAVSGLPWPQRGQDLQSGAMAVPSVFRQPHAPAWVGRLLSVPNFRFTQSSNWL